MADGYSIGDYEVLGRIGRGGMANVFLARTPDTRALVCLKLLRPEFAGIREAVLMLIDEANMLRRLDHLNCVAVVATPDWNERPFIVMEYVLGETIHVLLQQAIMSKNPLPENFVADLARSMCSALHHAHTLIDEHGAPLDLVHRDVSCGNIILGFDGVPKLLDFGVAKARDRYQVTDIGVIKGKFSFMAPEQIAGHRIDHRADIYSLGLVLYSLLANVNPYLGMDKAAVFHAKVFKALPPVRTMDATLAAVVNKAISRAPADRFQTIAQMEAALAGAPSGSDPAAILEARTPILEKQEALDALIATGILTDRAKEILHLDPLDATDTSPGTPGPPDISFTDATELDPLQAKSLPQPDTTASLTPEDTAPVMVAPAAVSIETSKSAGFGAGVLVGMALGAGLYSFLAGLLGG